MLRRHTNNESQSGSAWRLLSIMLVSPGFGFTGVIAAS